jgi:predicted RNase H-like HicB family nuclease
MIYIAFGESIESVLNAISAVLLYHLEDKLIKYLN